MLLFDCGFKMFTTALHLSHRASGKVYKFYEDSELLSKHAKYDILVAYELAKPKPSKHLDYDFQYNQQVWTKTQSRTRIVAFY